MNAVLLFGVGVTVLLVLFVGMYVGRKSKATRRTSSLPAVCCPSTS